MKQVEEILKSVSSRNDVRIEEGKVVLSGAISGTVPMDYCYELFQPLDNEEIQEIVANYRNPFPKPLEDFYRLTNGAFLFGRYIRIFGKPLWSAKYKQPVSLLFADGHRTRGCPKYRLFFASYNTEPEIQVFFDTRETGENMRVYAAKYGENDIIAEWNSFEDWFVSEYNKFEKKYRMGEYSIVDIVPGVLQSISFEMSL